MTPRRRKTLALNILLAIILGIMTAKEGDTDTYFISLVLLWTHVRLSTFIDNVRELIEGD